jgi:hypothetical protein
MTTAAGGTLTTSTRLPARLTLSSFSSPGPPSARSPPVWIPQDEGSRAGRATSQRWPGIAKPVQRRQVSQQPAHHPHASRHSRHLQQPQRVATEEPDRLAKRVSQPPLVRTSRHASPSLHIRPRQEPPGYYGELGLVRPAMLKRQQLYGACFDLPQARHARATTTSPVSQAPESFPSRDVRQNQFQ